MRGKVLRTQSGFFWVDTSEGILQCKLRGRLKKERLAADIAVIGDNVEVLQVAPNEGVIEAVIERHSCFSRRQPGPRGQWREDILIANLDQVVIIFAGANPPVNTRMLDRFLVVAEYNQIEAVIVVNKIDLVEGEHVHTQCTVYEALDYQVFYTSTHTGTGIEALRERLSGRISVFTGPSGVGKSSLLNAIQPGLELLTRDVSQALRKGRHTTVVAELHPLQAPQYGYVADTPGIRELAAWSIPEDELAWCFREMRPWLGQCAFNDCTHMHEPGCAIRSAVERGLIAPQRYDSYTRQWRNEER